MAESTTGGNNFRVFLASFLTIFAAGVGFGVRAVVLKPWGVQFGFTQTELGTITGGGLVGFGLVIILASLVLDSVGYKPILILAFLLHVLSGVVTLAASWVFASAGKGPTFAVLYWGTFMFAIANGLCEAAVNPLVATLYPKRKTHYLNILHASWPGGLIVGGLLAYCFMGEKPFITALPWEIPLGMFLVPVLMYGLLVLFEKMPKSEAKAAGVSIGEMFSQFAAPLLLLLLVIHAMVGYVELGTDSWITNIMDNVVKEKAILLFIYTSAMMFVLRFFAGPIVERINPFGLLTISGLLGFVGLTMLSKADAIGAAFLAASVYALGKTFLWPTMLGVVGERFPRGGALVMGTMGGIGMLSAGLLGGPIIGYEQDYYAQQELKSKSMATYDRYAVEKESSLYGLPPIRGLNGEKVAVLADDGAELARAEQIVTKEDRKDRAAENVKELAAWWKTASTTEAQDKPEVEGARLYGGRQALKLTAYVPLTMAALYFLLVIYFRLRGGYKQVEIHHHMAEGAMSEL